MSSAAFAPASKLASTATSAPGLTTNSAKPVSQPVTQQISKPDEATKPEEVKSERKADEAPGQEAAAATTTGGADEAVEEEKKLTEAE